MSGESHMSFEAAPPDAAPDAASRYWITRSAHFGVTSGCGLSRPRLRGLIVLANAWPGYELRGICEGFYPGLLACSLLRAACIVHTRAELILLILLLIRSGQQCSSSNMRAHGFLRPQPLQRVVVQKPAVHS